jgi:hypothetical protein
MGQSFGVTHVTVQKYLHHQRKSLELLPVSNLDFHAEIHLTD